VGEWAIAIGNPFGLAQTVTVGVITRRDARMWEWRPTRTSSRQMPASIPATPGAAAESKGKVIGINTAIFSQSGGRWHRLRHPINMVKRVMDQLVDKGKVVRGLARAFPPGALPELIDSLGVSDKRGALVSSAMPGARRRRRAFRSTT